ncbi:uncharacterized protein zgc:152968 isoform X3 [Solea solea]|uniref:uncharacterized protein zgc:152968 isoform X3 n=1 Tax=Solea solea TaxID=90069 RepID=UPI00272B2601|nr:uncharacterized protein zgc:152968 isoform X3 [Solea solea]
MFPSSGLFAGLICPVSKYGVCERPHCPYKHAFTVRDDVSGSSTVVDSAGVRNYYSSVCAAPVREETVDDSIQELERINKEIETVRHEVELEQRRLSCYQTIRVDQRNTVCSLSDSKSESAGKNADKGSCGLSSCTDFYETNTQVRKYVVDNSKPRTDLEYDPLSNFSAGLRSCSTSVKEQKPKIVQETRLVVQANTPSPEPLDSNEDSVLIIDIPPSPDKNLIGIQEPVCVAGNSKGTVEQTNEFKTAEISLDSSPLCFTKAMAYQITPCVSVRAAVKVYNHCDADKGQYQSSVNENKGCENIPAGGNVIDLTESLENLESECEKIANLPVYSDQQGQSLNNLKVEGEESTFQGELPESELSIRVAKLKTIQPHNLSSNISFFDKTSNLDSLCRQKTMPTQTMEVPAQNSVYNHCSLENSVSSLVSGSQNRALINKTSSVIYQEQKEPALVGNHYQTSVIYHSHLANGVDSSEPNEQLLVEFGKEDVITISSSEEEELNYSDMDLSDSDPMEECYRIFMEANNEDGKGREEQTSLSDGTMDVEKQELTVAPQVLPGKKRVAHEAKHTEQPMAKIRPEPQVLVPLRGPVASGFGSQTSVTSKIQQVQQRASMVAASIKGGQAFVSMTSQKKQETQTTAGPSTHAHVDTQPAPVQNAYTNYLSLGTAVIEVGNNLHFILPEGTFPFPVTSSSSPVTSVLTPVRIVPRSNHLSMKQLCHKAAITPVQRYHTTAPVLIPAQTRKPSLASASAHSNPAASTTTPPAAHTVAAKPVPTKRKLKQEAAKEKVPHDLRQRYVNIFTEEFLKTTANVNDAFEKAVAEERTVYNRSANKLKYLSVAVNSLKRLKNLSAASAQGRDEVNGHGSKGNIPLHREMLRGNDDMALYEGLKDYLLTEEKLIESNFPVQHPEKPGCAALFADPKKGITDPLKRICCRCGATYSVSQSGKHVRKEECTYHYGKGVENRVPGGVETRYSCCQGVMGAPGCQVFQLHVHDSLSLEGFVSTSPRHSLDKSCPGVYSLDCEMCYTVHGLELSRVTVVNSSLQVIYDTFVRPDNEVIDYNTRFSGISVEDVKSNKTSIREVHETLLSFISADTILIGHGLEMDLCALKLFHGNMVDTSVVFPHRLGPPHKLTLNNLTAEYLRKIIQESVCGHDTAEDATACMELILWKAKDGKLKK